MAGTRVTLDTVISAFAEGAAPEGIRQRYPTLDLADVYAVLGYYLQHRTDVDAYLRRRGQEAEDLRREIETRFDPHGLRDRLLARRASAGAPDAL
ncbi:MAG: DUF433 domain-containing protein [Chloroflexota bacterium]